MIATVLNGRKGSLGQMPVWKDKLDDQQIAAVVTYLRQAWSNRAAGRHPGHGGWPREASDIASLYPLAPLILSWLKKYFL